MRKKNYNYIFKERLNKSHDNISPEYLNLDKENHKKESRIFYSNSQINNPEKEIQKSTFFNNNKNLSFNIIDIDSNLEIKKNIKNRNFIENSSHNKNIIFEDKKDYYLKDKCSQNKITKQIQRYTARGRNPEEIINKTFTISPNKKINKNSKNFSFLLNSDLDVNNMKNKFSEIRNNDSEILNLNRFCFCDCNRNYLKLNNFSKYSTLFKINDFDNEDFSNLYPNRKLKFDFDVQNLNEIDRVQSVYLFNDLYNSDFLYSKNNSFIFNNTTRNQKNFGIREFLKSKNDSSNKSILNNSIQGLTSHIYRGKKYNYTNKNILDIFSKERKEFNIFPNSEIFKRLKDNFEFFEGEKNINKNVKNLENFNYDSAISFSEEYYSRNEIEKNIFCKICENVINHKNDKNFKDKITRFNEKTYLNRQKNPSETEKNYLLIRDYNN